MNIHIDVGNLLSTKNIYMTRTIACDAFARIND